MKATLIGQCLAAFRATAQSAAAGISARQKKGLNSTEDLAGLLVAYNMWFEELLKIALVHWRHSTGDPAMALREALATAREATEFFPRLPFSMRKHPPLSFGLAALLCPLVDHPEDPFVPLLPRPDDFPDLTETPLRPLGDAVLMWAFLDGKVPPAAGTIARQLGFRRKPPSLFGRTFDCCTRIIAAGLHGRWAEAKRGVEEAYGLYEERKTNRAFRHGLELDAGGPLNELFVDFRLGAIVRRTFQGKPEEAAFGPPHCWPV